MPCLQRIVSIPISGGNSCSTFSFSDFGYHLGRPLPSLLLPGVYTTCVEKHYPFDPSFIVVLPLDTDGFVFRRNHLPAESISTELRRRRGAELLVGGVED